MTSTAAVPCATHPATPTMLRCGKCDKPICPKCLVYTPVGARCRECANVRRLPTFNVSSSQYVRAIGIGIAAAIAIGVLWGFALKIPFLGGFFSLIIAGVAGYAIGESISQSVNRRQGRPLEIIAGLSVFFALLNAQVLPDLGRLLLAGFFPPPGLVLGAYVSALIGTVTSIFGLVAVLIGVVVAVSRFR